MIRLLPHQEKITNRMLSYSKGQVISPTGSGKTMAFLIPTLARLNKPSKAFARALVIDPTRELAQQTLRELNRLLCSLSASFLLLFL